MLMNSREDLATIEQVKQEIKTAQYRAAVRVNSEGGHFEKTGI